MRFLAVEPNRRTVRDRQKSPFPAVYYASFLFPVRHFVEINQNLLYGDYGFAYTWQNVAALFLFIPAALLLLPRLKRAVLSHRYENID